MPKIETCFAECVGAVSFLLDDRIVLQGTIIHDRDRHCDDPPKLVKVKAEVEIEPEFITVRLKCDAAIIRDDGCLATISPPLFQAGDFVRINVSEIIAIGPFHECPPGPAPCAV